MTVANVAHVFHIFTLASLYKMPYLCTIDVSIKSKIAVQSLLLLLFCSLVIA